MVKIILETKEENDELIQSVAQDLDANTTEKSISELAKHERKRNQDDMQSMSGDS